jgi:hypothetical protein
MSESQIRGYSIRRTASFIDKYFDPGTAERVKREVPAEVWRLAEDLQPGQWYPRKHAVMLYEAIAAAHSNPDDSYRDLVACGEHICVEATNTFFRILMRIMTPTLFAKKLPSFWRRDQQGGAFEYDLSGVDRNSVRLILLDVADYPHIAPVTVGFFQFFFRAMGKRNVEVQQDAWSPTCIAPANVNFDVTWS